MDWAEASSQPFGFALYALDNTLGSMGPDGWEYFDNADYLRRKFWANFQKLVEGLPETQMQSIRLARAAGLLIRYGTVDHRGFGRMVGVRHPSDDSLHYLDSLLSTQGLNCRLHPEEKSHLEYIVLRDQKIGGYLLPLW